MSRSLFSDFLQSARNPDFWAYSAWLDIVTRYRRSQLGMLWMFVPVVAFIVVLGYFYAGLINKPPREFIPFLAIGYSLWRLIIQVINESASALFHHQSFIMDGRVTLTDYFLRVLSKSAFHFLPALIVIIGTLLWSGHLGLGALEGLCIGFPIVILNLTWLTVIISLIGARFPDIHELVTSVLVFGFLLTPILWYPDSVPADSLRGLFMRVNPAYHLIEIVRAPILGSSIEPSTIGYLVGMTITGWVVAAWLYRRYSRYVPLWF